MASGRNNRAALYGFLATLGIAAVIGALTLSPVPSLGAPGSDKLHHVLAFAALAIPLPVVRPRLAPWIFLGVVTYGGLIELIQPNVGRHAEWADLFADAGGALLGASVGAAIGLLRASRDRGQ